MFQFHNVWSRLSEMKEASMEYFNLYLFGSSSLVCNTQARCTRNITERLFQTCRIHTLQCLERRLKRGRRPSPWTASARVHQLHIDPQNMSDVALKGVKHSPQPRQDTSYHHIIRVQDSSDIQPLEYLSMHTYVYYIYIYIYICMVKNIAFWINTWYNL